MFKNLNVFFKIVIFLAICAVIFYLLSRINGVFLIFANICLIGAGLVFLWYLFQKFFLK